MKDFFAAMMKRLNKIGTLPILALSLCSVIICGMMYMKASENNRLLLDLVSQNGLQTIAPAEIPLSTFLYAGDTITVRVNAEKVSDMYGYQFKLNYDESAMQYKSIRSSVDEITTIFQKPFKGYLLVGATKVGKSKGFNGKDTPICEIVMTVTKDGPVSGLSITEINVVNSSLRYDQSVKGWSFEIVT